MLRGRVITCFRLLASGAILVWLLQHVPLADINKPLATLSWVAITVAFVLVMASEALRAIRFRILAQVQGFSVPVLRLFRINLGTRFYMLFLPGGALASIATRFYKLQLEDPRRASALSVVMLDRLCATIGLCFIGALFWFIDTQPVRPDFGLINLIAAVVTGCMILFLVNPRSYLLIEKFGNTIANGLLRRAYGKWRSAVTLFAVMPASGISKVFVLSIAPHLSEVLAFAILGNALGIPLELATWGWVRSTVVLLTMLPLSFAGLGVREVSLVVLLATYGVPAEKAVALSASLFGVLILMPAALGALSELVDFVDHSRKTYPKPG